MRTFRLIHIQLAILSGCLASVTEYVDTLLKRLVSALDNMKLRDNTIIIFTSDNGTQGKGKIWSME